MENLLSEKVTMGIKNRDKIGLEATKIILDMHLSVMA